MIPQTPDPRPRTRLPSVTTIAPPPPPPHLLRLHPMQPNVVAATLCKAFIPPRPPTKPMVPNSTDAIITLIIRGHSRSFQDRPHSGPVASVDLSKPSPTVTATKIKHGTVLVPALLRLLHLLQLNLSHQEQMIRKQTRATRPENVNATVEMTTDRVTTHEVRPLSNNQYQLAPRRSEATARSPQPL